MQGSQVGRPQLKNIEVTEGTDSVGVAVDVEFEDTTRRGAAAGRPDELRASCARATLRAVELGRPLTLLLAGARSLKVADVDVAIVVVHVRQMDRPMVGSAAIPADDEPGAFVRATLDAINRAVALTAPLPDGTSGTHRREVARSTVL